MSKGTHKRPGWSPHSEPDLPDRVTKLEVVQERLQRVADRAIRLLVTVVVELAIMLLGGAGVVTWYFLTAGGGG